MATGLVKRLGEGLEKADLDQAEVAWVLGASARTVSRVAPGGGQPSARGSGANPLSSWQSSSSCP
jgi:hypothetical protein